MAGEIFVRLHDYCDRFKTAVPFTSGAGYILRSNETELLRKPDASVVLLSRLPNGVIPSTRFDFSPDLAVEVISPSDNSFDVETKIQDYLDAGTKIVWLAKPKSKRITVYLPDGSETTFGATQELTAGDLLPGFTMRVGDVFS